MPAASPAPRPPPPPARPAPSCPAQPAPGKYHALWRPPGRGRRRGRGSPSVSPTRDPAPCAVGPQCRSRGGTRSKRGACVCVCVATPAEARLLGVRVNAVPIWVPVPRCPEGLAWETRGHPGRCGGAVGEGRRPRGSQALLSMSTCQVLYLELTSFHPSSPQTCKEGGFIPICQMRKQRFTRSHGLIATKLGFKPRFPQLL